MGCGRGGQTGAAENRHRAGSGLTLDSYWILENHEMETSQSSTAGPTAESISLPVIREHIVATQDTCGGKPRIGGRRIQVKHGAIMAERQGMRPSDIVSEFPHLTLAGVHAALAYYHDHREELNAEIAADREWYEE